VARINLSIFKLKNKYPFKLVSMLALSTKQKPLLRGFDFLALIVMGGFSRRLACKLVASNPTLSSNIFFIRIDVGFAYILQAAVRLASSSLRITFYFYPVLNLMWDSPTFCRPRFGLQAEPFESHPRACSLSPQKTKAPKGALIFWR
jgi:hypothetical protein